MLAQINQKTKPPGSLGKLEKLALQIALIQGTAERNLRFNNPHVVVFAADHGIARHQVSIAGSEVTAQMVGNFLAGGAAINALSKANQCTMTVINSGVKHDIAVSEIKDVKLLEYVAGKGTMDFSETSAMSEEQFQFCLAAGAAVIEQHTPTECDVIAFGEMGIGNTSSAAALLALLHNLKASDAVGRGTGISDQQLQTKTEIVHKAIDRVSPLYLENPDAKLLLKEVGGFEIVQMCSAMLIAAKHKKIVVVDGFIVTAAAMLACAIEPTVRDYMVFAHQSEEQAHAFMLQTLQADPLLSLDMRLGEGTGAVLAMSILRSAVAFYNDMSTFESVGIKV